MASSNNLSKSPLKVFCKYESREAIVKLVLPVAVAVVVSMPYLWEKGSESTFNRRPF